MSCLSAERPYALSLVALFVALSAASGCYDHHVCGEPESCDYDDNDCDRMIDEDFLDEDGIYFTPEHCGGCGVSCAAELPTALETTCTVRAGDAFCEIVSCPEGFHLADPTTCAPDVPALCLPCSEDPDLCALLDPETRCLELPSSPGDFRCLPRCGAGCPDGFECSVFEEDFDACVPMTGECGCTAETEGLTFGCIVRRDDDYACAGALLCTREGLSECEPALTESCNERDDDCDGGVDEDFRDEEGRYVARLHCGGCATPCVEPGPNMLATCAPAGARVRCDIECLEGFVDVDGIAANGCECERFDGIGPPPVAGGDTDCDGVPDEVDDFIYVTSAGNDRDPGTLSRPMRTPRAALARAQSERKDVLIARGIYTGFSVVGGVSLFGGYRPDFRDRDLTLYPVVFEEPDRPGEPVIRCDDVSTATRLEGFMVQGSDASGAGQGSTAAFLNGCTVAVVFSDVTVIAGRGANGLRGDSSSDNLSEIGLMSLTELDGSDGQNGQLAADVGLCTVVPAGARRPKMCPSGPVDGGAGGTGGCPDLGCMNGSACGNAGCTDFTSDGVCNLDAAVRIASPNGAAEPGRGPSAGAAGELTYNAPTNRDVCNFCDDNPTLPRNGQRGGDGANGSDGTAGSGCGIASRLSTDGRVAGGDGTAGTSGSDGSGGGGGTAGAGYAVIGGTMGTCDDRAGGSGGSGGSGGCGAPRAEGGTGGGSSIGIAMSLRSARGPLLENVRVVTASGGSGGDGGNGAAGGSPGTGGNGGRATFWCARTGGRGGDGGRGGAAGGGGGGCAGGAHAIYIESDSDATSYARELRELLELDETGVAGRGGRGGTSPVAPGGDGLDGSSDVVFLAP